MGSLRIVAGALRGRRIRVPGGLAVRPTSDRAREALFSVLGSSVEGARVLDAYAGSGALGFEALSRGARRVVFVEADPAVARLLADNAGALGVATSCRIVRDAVLRALAGLRPEGPFDLILADPPYASGERRAFLDRVGRVGLLAPDGQLVLERDVRTAAVEAPDLPRIDSRSYGRTALDFHRREGSG